MISKPKIPVVRPARVADDSRFLRWLDYAKEALPVEVELDEEPPGSVVEPAPTLEPAEKTIDHIPEAIVMKRSGGAKIPAAAPAPPKVDSQPLKNLAGTVPHAASANAHMPAKRKITKKGTKADKGETIPLDTSRFISFNEYNEGQTRIAPLKRGNAIDGERGLERPKFLDGKLPRSVERGVLHPQPGRLIVAALFLVLAKLMLIAVVLVFPVVAFLDFQIHEYGGDKHYIKQALPLLVAFLGVGLIFLITANKARCRVCSCHFFYLRNCHKHKSAHRLPLLGPATTGALHLMLFKWMRCMYCGTAIRLRGSTGVGKPSKNGSNYDPEEDED